MAGFTTAVTFGEFATRARSGSLSPVPSGRVPIPEAAARVVQQLLVSDIKGRIASGTALDGSKFRPLKYPRANGGNIPLRDTGLLLASITGGHDRFSVWAGTTHPGAALLNFGGEVRAKGKMLAIPLTREAKRSGGPRRFKKKLEFRPTGKRRVFVLGTEEKGVFTGQFLLVDKVSVPAREFMGVSDKATVQIGQALLELRGW